MTDEKDIRAVVDEDIAHAEAVWDASSYDSEAMEALFGLLMEHYGDQIDGFVKGLRVIQPYEDIKTLTNVCVITEFLGQGSTMPDVTTPDDSSSQAEE